jgi:hypothetical protein
MAAAIAAVVIAGCGSNSSNSPGSGRHLTYAQAQNDAVHFARCMRSHGVPSFPDPTSPRQFKESMSPGSPITRSPAFASATAACQHLLPGGGPHQSAGPSQAKIAVALAFARCIRTHGFPSFPDPTSSGELTHQMLANAGIDLHQPAVLQAAYACIGVTHGAITRASVARFVAGR